MTKQDLHRLIREVEALDNYILQNSIRGQKSAALPRLTTTLESLIRDNTLEIMDDKSREALRKTLSDLLKTAPVVHMSFAIEPSSFMTQKIVSWFRNEVHPALMLHTGIQPTIAAGCVMRTSNKYFDFSLRQHLRASQNLLAQSIREHTEQAAQIVAPAQVTAPVDTPTEVKA
jgi:F0F1-type ATP synthase delta subunit